MAAAEINPRLWDASTPLVERVALAFDEKGPLTKAVKGFCVREGQREFAVEAARAVEEKTILVAEAGTGTGKTFAYLTPALLAGATCVISTAGKSLQDQLCAKDLPALRDALGVPVKVALLKGRANYVCHFRLELTASEGRLPEQDSYLKLRKIQRFAAVSRTGDRAELPDVPEDDRLWPLVTSTRENCLGKDRCPNYDDCFVKKAREDAMQSQVVVVNHHLYLSSMALKRESDAIDGMLPQAALTVIDEAHQLPGIASSFFGTSFSTYDVENVSMEARRLGRTKCNDGAEWEILYDRVLKAGREFRLDAQRIGLAEGERLDVDEIEDFGELYPGFERLRAAFAAMGEAMRANEGRDNELDTLAERHAELMEQMEAWTAIFVKCRNGAADEASEGEAAGDAEVGGEAGPEAGAASGADAEVRWLEVSQHGIRFNLTPLSFAEEFREMREREGGAWVFTSATLSSAGRFDLFKQRLGIGECVERTWESPFNYWEQGCFYLPQMPPPANNTAVHTHNVIEKVWPLINAAGGRTFVLCTSLAAVRAAADELQARLEANGNPYPLFVQGDGPKMRLIEEFRAHGNAVLVGSMSFWEGVDVKGEALSLVVIDKIPFAPPNDPVMMARSRAVEASGRRPFDEITLPEAVITLKQGAGRLIRSEGDRGMLVICDPRILNKGYGKVVRDSLPDFYCTRREEKALEFFLNPERFREGLYRG
ncbi:MAG: ATP-dependent DNA helicase [Sutterella wadsworthensis]|nr:ATP-dependent DNA helicase [Sutterella sp.]MBS1372920.1 ATP-dependent DNA helicase [Sutterella sp.]MBS6615224.1 ATP-dependent DNA helicase [Sutterella wadsworthensis]